MNFVWHFLSFDFVLTRNFNFLFFGVHSRIEAWIIPFYSFYFWYLKSSIPLKKKRLSKLLVKNRKQFLECKQAHTHTQTHKHTNTQTHTHTHTHTRTQERMHKHKQAHTHPRTHAHTHTEAHAHTHKYVHMRTRTHTQ